MTATEIAEYEQEKEVYRKMGIDIESVWRHRAWEDTEPIRKALFMQEALKTETVIEVEAVTVQDRDTLTEILKRRRRFQRAFGRHLWKSVPHRGRQIEKCRLMYAKRRMRFGRMIYNAIQSAFDEVVFGVG